MERAARREEEAMEEAIATADPVAAGATEPLSLASRRSMTLDIEVTSQGSSGSCSGGPLSASSDTSAAGAGALERARLANMRFTLANMASSVGVAIGLAPPPDALAEGGEAAPE